MDQLQVLPDEITITKDMVDEDTENEVIIEESIEEEIVETEIAEQEIEIETERSQSPEEILPDVKLRTNAPPPLRPLTIAPKPMAGQQLLLLQDGDSGQTIKLISQGQELNLGNVSLGRPIAIKPTTKPISVMQPKQMVMKKILVPNQKTPTKQIYTTNKSSGHIMVVQKNDLQSSINTTTQPRTLPTPTKTITLQQAQEMGLLTTPKIQMSTSSTQKTAVLLNKGGQSKTIKIIPQVAPAQLVTVGGTTKMVSQIKTPTKILPATSTITTSGGGSKPSPRFVLKSGTTSSTTNVSPQVIQVSGTTLNANQLHQINIPGKGVQFFKFIPANETVSTTTPKTTNTIQTTSAGLMISEVKSISGQTTLAPKPIRPTTTTKSPTTQQIVVLPNYIANNQTHTTTNQSQLATKIVGQIKQVKELYERPSNIKTEQQHTLNVSVQTHHHQTSQPAQPQPPQPSSPVGGTETTSLESNGMRPRKPCNCTKSQCLKLYCDCFANGEFCYMCNCMNCCNNLDNEEHRQRAIKTCLERNPMAFRPKIGKAKDVSGDNPIRKHTKGCNCKRSGCLKNYCECYEAKIACSNNCKCFGCRNVEDVLEKKNFRNVDNDLGTKPFGTNITPRKEHIQFRPRRSSNTKLFSRQAINFITDDVIEATAQCMLTISDSGEVNMQDEELTKRQIIEEFGRCLTEIINYSSVNN